MKRIVAVVILVLAVLMFSTSGVLAEKKIKPVKFTIDVEGEKKIKVELVGYDDDGNPIFLDHKGQRAEKVADTAMELPKSAELLISVHYQNPCWVCTPRGCYNVCR